jgi:hypothetical protein
MLCDQLWKADYARTKVEMRALELGVVCSRPVVEGTRYDCILDYGGKLYRAQIKYANGKTTNTVGVVQVNLRKEIKGEKNHPYLEHKIDVLLVYLPKIDRICWFGPEVFNGRPNLAIRIAPSRNGQQKRCLPAENYLW